jgi:hypothetical protein
MQAAVDPRPCLSSGSRAEWSLQLQRGMLHSTLGREALVSHRPFLLVRRAGDLPLQNDIRYFDDLIVA